MKIDWKEILTIAVVSILVSVTITPMIQNQIDKMKEPKTE